MSSDIPPEVRRIFAAAPFIESLGIQLDSIGHGECTTSVEVARQHLQQDGFVHAGVQATLADHTAGAAAATLLEAGQWVLTAQFSIQLLRAAKGERLLCHARVLRPGRRFSVVESEVFVIAEGTRRLVSKLTSTVAVLSATEAGG